MRVVDEGALLKSRQTLRKRSCDKPRRSARGQFGSCDFAFEGSRQSSPQHVPPSAGTRATNK